MKNRYRSRKKTSSFKSEDVQIRIESLGAQGDGIGFDDQGRKFFVPFSAPGDIVLAKTYRKNTEGFFAKITETLEKDDGRIEPPCPYFSKCGGCALQHIKEADYQNFKRQKVEDYLKRALINHPEIETIFIEPRTRRRVTFGLVKKGRKVVFGFNEKASNKLVEIESCLVLDPELEKLINPLRNLMSEIINREAQGDVSLTKGSNGFDLNLVFPGWPELKEQEKLIAFAQNHQINRITWQQSIKDSPELLAEFSPVQVNFGDVFLNLAPAPFLQPSVEGEKAMSDFIAAAIKDEKRLLDLYAGCGSLSFGVAKGRTVHAVEINKSALNAMSQAAGRHQLGGSITAEVRDLDRQPFAGKELEKYDCVIFDPPRAGAQAQSEQLAKSDIPLVIAISCNPATFARDAAILIEGGYKLDKMALFDQFTWSSHVEVGAVFRK